MSFGLDEFRSRGANVGATQERITHLRSVTQEAVRAAAVTGSPEWDFFLRYIEANIKASERMAETKKNQAAALVLTDEPAAKAAAVLAATYQVRAETLKEVIALPRQIKENGELAEKRIAELEASL